MPDGSYPSPNYTREGALVRALYRSYGGAYVAQESYSSMFANRILPWVRGIVDNLKTHMFPQHYHSGKFDVIVQVTTPSATPASARRVGPNQPSQHYNLKLTIIIQCDGRNIWDRVILVPVMVGSRHCHSYGKSAIERQIMGLGASESGGYVINGRGGLTVIRSMETAHQARPKIISNEKATADARKDMERHTENALAILSDYAQELELQKMLPKHLIANYLYSKDDIGKIEEPGVVRMPRPVAKPVNRGRPKKKPGSANAGVNAALLAAHDDSPEFEAPMPSQHNSQDTLNRLSRVILTEPPKKKPRKRPTMPVTEDFLVRCTYEDIHALPTSIQIYAVGLVYYVWISLPRVNKKIHVASETYVPMALGITALGGRLLSMFHALFFAREYLNNDQANDSKFYTPGSMKNYRNEISEAIMSVTDPEIAPGIEAALAMSFQQYDETVRLLSPFELFVSFYSQKPSTVSIVLPYDLVKYAVDYIVPLSGFTGNDHYLAKARALATMLVAQFNAMETKDSSDLHSYKNKMVNTAGAAIFRMIRERLNLIFRTMCVNGVEGTDQAAKIRAASKPTCILSSFSPHDGPGSMKGEGGAQATMTLPWETVLKALMLIRVIAVPGSAYVPQAARMIQFDQVGSIDIMYTPESGDVGKRKEPAELGLISMYRDPSLLERYLCAAVADAAEFGIAPKREDVRGTGIRLLYIEAIPYYYISSEFYLAMRKYFRTNGPVRNDIHHPYGLQPSPAARNATSRVQTFDIVFSDDGGRYTIYHSGGVVGHLALVPVDGELLLDDPEYRRVNGDPWRNANPDRLIDDGAIAFVSPMETYFQCTSVPKFYDTPSIDDMPLVDGVHTRDEDTIRNCQDLCPWCWHLATPPNHPRQSKRLDRDGQRNPGVYGNVVQTCKCRRRWHDHCLRLWHVRVGRILGDDECPVCNNNFDDVPTPPRDFREDYDYVMVDPSTMLGVSSGTVPNAGESYAVRTAYQSNMSLQSLDMQPGVEQKRDLNVKVALEAQVPICATEMGATNERDCHNGVNLLWANRMMPQNNEDGIYISETAARGLRYQHIQTVTAPSTQKGRQIRHNGKWYEVEAEFMGMCPSVDKKKFHAIDPQTGLPRIGAFVHPDDALYARYAVVKGGLIIDQTEYCSVEIFGYIYQMNVRGILYDPKNPNPIQVTANLHVSISLAVQYCYLVGDKLCARYSQKGVVAVILPRREMGVIVGGPFDGCVPDGYNAPTTLPSRMTVAMITEQYASKAALFTCEQVDATAFRHRTGISDEYRMVKNPKLAEYVRILKENGCTDGVMETLRLPNGVEEKVLFGPIRYLMLRHHAPTKTKRSAYNPMRIGDDIFRQSTKGRQGNLRIGYQEGQGFYSQATPYTMQELISMGASSESLLACESCGLFATLPPSSGLRYVCDNCSGDLVAIKTVYSLAVLIQILATRGIDMRFFPVPNTR